MHIAFIWGSCAVTYFWLIYWFASNDEFKMKFPFYSNERLSHQPNSNACKRNLKIKSSFFSFFFFFLKQWKYDSLFIIRVFRRLVLSSFLPCFLRFHHRSRHVCVKYEIVWFDLVDGKWKMFEIHLWTVFTPWWTAI